MMRVSKPFVSVIIPVYKNFESLKLCLKALAKQSYPKDKYEVIVVDNESNVDNQSLIGEFASVTFLREIYPGSYAARNKGILHATGEVLAFTDSDCVPAPDWIARGTANLLSHSNCGLVGGKIELFFKDPRRPNAIELFEKCQYGFSQKRNIEDRHFGMTANVFTFRRVISVVGNFKDELKSHGDREWGRLNY